MTKDHALKRRLQSSSSAGERSAKSDQESQETDTETLISAGKKETSRSPRNTHENIKTGSVYVLFDERAVVYVGQSTNPYARVGSHTRDKEFTHFRILRCHRDRMKYWEAALIKKHRPQYNVVGNPDKCEVVKLPTAQIRPGDEIQRRLIDYEKLIKKVSRLERQIEEMTKPLKYDGPRIQITNTGVTLSDFTTTGTTGNYDTAMGNTRIMTTLPGPAQRLPRQAHPSPPQA